jgi:molybdopterin-containing oxidoreductase family iron-sulfur binding subunit
MNKPLNQPAPPVTGRRYWRSLDELADTAEFKDWLQREFPAGASELEDGFSRRHFVRIMSASFLLAGVGIMGAGCRRPEAKLEPFGKQPENYTFGEAQYFATAMPTRDGAVPLVAKSYEGRPVKVEGNAEFPGGNGSTDRYAQASILDVYDPDRSKRFKQGGKTVTPEAGLAFLSELSQTAAAANGGQGLVFLTDRSTSPSRRRLQDLISRKFMNARWYAYEPVDSDIHQRAATMAFSPMKVMGVTSPSVRPVYHFEKAKVIVSLGSDFLGSEDDVHNHIRRYVQGRKPESGGMSRLYVIESLFTLTGAGADHRLRVPPSQMAIRARALYDLLQSPPGAVKTPAGSAVSAWIAECALDLAANKGNALVVAGQSQPLEVHLLAHAINSALGAIGNTVTLHPVPVTNAGTIQQLASVLNAGAVNTLVILGGNPVYNAPADLNWAVTQRKAKTVVRLGYYEDETFAQTDWHFPATHYLESWGDAITSDGTLVPVQPLIQPLFGGLTELEFLVHIAGETQTSAYDIVRTTFGGSEAAWKKFLFNGYQPDSAAAPVNASFSGPAPVVAAPAEANLEVIFHRDAKVDDGRYANNGWMQELPDPVTKITWDNAVLLSRKTARDLDVANGDLVEVTLNGRTVTGPIWTQPGMADNTLGLALGYGRTAAGRVGTGVGFNAYSVFTGSYLATGATLKKTGATYVIATTQHHWSMEGRPIVREANWDEFKKHPKFAEEMHGVEAPIVQSLYPNPLDEAKKTALHQWGMSIDLTACVGCGTCVVACQSENNIPIVGKDQVSRGREMHWMRIDRYYTADPAKETLADSFQKDDEQQFAEWIDDVQAVNQPMLCQQCEAAPCENVCPVNATVHDQEGLNVMAYNRCIGTRYCSNNCPYKVRRFNYLDYNKRPLAELKGPMYSTAMFGSKTGGELDVLRWWKNSESGMREQDEWDLIKMVKNPDVTVRMRGVMEKCTYCTQRIEHAKIKQKAKAGASDDVRLRESAGNIPKTACQQACPAGAIVFGDVSDPESSVSQLKDAGKLSGLRNYTVLGDLLTKPRTTYLSRIRNPNPAMPDYREWPHSFEEYEKHNGDPFGRPAGPAAKGNS